MAAKSAPIHLSLFSLCALVVANMVGTGVFTSLGFQLVAIRSGFVLLLLWGLGGLCALCGALSYAELGTIYCRSGGEYTILSRIYGRPVGFLAGWVSVTAGFAAPVALAAMALGSYAHRIQPWIAPGLLAQGAIVLLTLIHILLPRLGLIFQDGFTALKVVILVVLIAAGALAIPGGDASFRFRAADLHQVASAPFAIGLVFVMYAYSGWNASIYVASDCREPKRDLPRSLVLGTLVVTLFYVGLNWVFLRVTPIEHMVGRTEIGLIAAMHILGPVLGRWMGAAIVLLLVSTVSAMIWIGPRVIQVMGEDYPVFGWLAAANRGGVPAWAMVLQSALSMVFIASGTYDRVLVYAQFSLLLCTFLATVGVVVLRFTQPGLARPYRTWGYPVTPVVFAAVTLWMLVYIGRFRPLESMMGLATLVAGLAIYRLSLRFPVQAPRTAPPPE
jgi:APA family basic amino acid/polyamine antiporter